MQIEIQSRNTFSRHAAKAKAKAGPVLHMLLTNIGFSEPLLRVARRMKEFQVGSETMD